MKCAVNENPSVRKCRFKFLVWKFVNFYEGDHAFKTIWRLPCLCHLIKIKGYFFQPGRLVFIIVINTSFLAVCYRIYAWQKFLNNARAPNGALALFEIFAGRISCRVLLPLIYFTTLCENRIQSKLSLFVQLLHFAI